MDITWFISTEKNIKNTICYLQEQVINELCRVYTSVELKWDKSAQGAIAQIKEKNYAGALKEYAGSVLLVGINYNKKKKTHECVIE